MNGNYYPQPPPMGMPYQQQTQYYAQPPPPPPPPSAYPPQYAPQPYAPMPPPLQQFSPPQQYAPAPLPPQPMMTNPRLSFGHHMSHHGMSMLEIQTDLPPYGYPQQMHHSGPPSPMPMMQPPVIDAYDQELISRSSAMGTSDGETPPRPKRVNSMKKKTSSEAVNKKKISAKKDKEKEEEGAFSYSVFEMGNFGPCLFSCCCTPCASAQTRTHLDGSPFCFNLLAMNPCVTRWLVRSAYNIPGSVIEDICLATCCPCCTVNQMYQTTIDRGSPVRTKPFVDGTLDQSCTGSQSITKFFFGLICTPCIVGSTLETAFGMPFCFGFCCVNSCAMANIIRYHYRMGGNTCCDDIMPRVVLYLVAFMACACPCGWSFFVAYVINVTLGYMNKAEDSVGTKGPPKYLNP